MKNINTNRLILILAHYTLDILPNLMNKLIYCFLIIMKRLFKLYLRLIKKKWLIQHFYYAVIKYYIKINNFKIINLKMTPE